MCINIWKQILCKYIFSSIANLKYTPSDRQRYPWGYMYPRLGTPVYRNQPIGLCFLLFAMFQTCAYLYSSNFIPQVK